MQKKDQLQWNLDDVLPRAEFDKLYAKLSGEIEEIDVWWKKLSPKMRVEEFRKFLERDQEVDVEFSRLSYLPELMEATNQKDPDARLMKTRVSDLALKYSEKSRKIGHWLKGLPVEGKETLDDVNAKRLFKAIPDLEYGLSYSRQAAKYTLSQKEEEVIDNKDVNVGSALSDIRGLIEADMEYTVGKKKIKTQAQLLKLIHSKSGKVREAAYRALFNEHKKQLDKLFVIYQAVVKDWNYEARKRGYSSAIGMRNFGNHIPDEAVETLLEVCREEKGIFHRYFRFKAEALGKKKLNRFDLYAPMKKVEDREYDFETSKKLVLESFEKFGQQFAGHARKVFEDQHIDSHPYKNKRSGAFCATVVPQITPYVLLNHTGTSRDVSTLAHELGHAVHSLYASHHYPSAQHANLPLSETASTLGEMILFEKMLEEEKDPAIKRQMLWEKMGESYATILRQNYFVMFEVAAHEAITQGTTAEELSKRYLQNLKEQFGSAVTVEPIFKYEWLYISHIFESPFYCYAYNFGELLSLSLYARFKDEGKTMVPRIEKLLSAGGSENPSKLLAEIGVDITSKEFWKNGFKILEGWQFRLEHI